MYKVREVITRLRTALRMRRRHYLCRDPPPPRPGVSGATLYVEAQCASALAAACAEDLVAGMAASGGLPAVDWERPRMRGC